MSGRGGGRVACRKVLALLDCGAAVTVVSPVLCSSLKQKADNREIKFLLKQFTDDDLEEVRLAIAATGSRQTNQRWPMPREGRRYWSMWLITPPFRISFYRPC